MATITPTRMVLNQMKGRLKTASRGHKLLKDKRDELMRQFMDVVRRNKELRTKVEQGLTEAFGALSVALACGWTPLPVSIPVVIAAALVLLRMTERSRMGADAAIAVTSASALAVGIIVTSLTTGMTTDVDSFMFGSILALDRADVALSVGVSAAVLVLYVLFYHRLFAITFDESFSRATGMRVELYNTVLSVLTALTIVLGMRLMGAMLISSLVIFPALTAMRLLRSFRGVVICAGVLSVACFCAGLTGSYLLSTPVGATVVLADLAAFLLACGAAGLKKRA